MAAAEAFLKRFVDAGGTQEEAELERALRESQEGNVRNADRVIRHCSDYPDDPNGPFMLEALAIGLLKAGPPPKTIECLDLWLSRSISPADCVQALVWRGRALQQQGLAPDAADEFRKALAIDDSKTEARLLLAQFLTRHEPEIAMVHFVRLDADLPGNKDVRFGLARCHRQLGNLKEAEKLLNGLLTEYPDDVPMLIEAGALALDGGRADQAEKHLRKALTLRPKSRDANVQLARCLQDLGREAEANEQRERIKKLDEELFGKYDDPARKP
jgi:tetratricopeptide (TPR) repeat protein